MIASLFYRFQHIGMCRNKEACILSPTVLVYEETPIEDWDQVPRLEIVFRGNFLTGSVFIVLCISECVEIKTFHFFITYGFRFMKEAPTVFQRGLEHRLLLQRTGTKYPRLKLAIRGNFLIGSVFYRSLHLRMCRNQNFSFLYHSRFPFYEAGPYRGLGPSMPVSK